LAPSFPSQLIVELDFPSNLDAINAVLLTYLNSARRPAHSLFVLDVSGSMRGHRLDHLESALNTLAGGNSTLTGRFARFQERERVTLIPFSSRAQAPTTVDIGTGSAAGEGLGRVREFTNGLQAGGGTALYSALAEAYRTGLEFMKKDPARYYSIVLM